MFTISSIFYSSLVKILYYINLNIVFWILGYLIEPNPSSNKGTTNGVTLQRSNSLTSLASTTGVEDLSLNNKDGTNHEDYLRICLSCRQLLQRRYDQLCFKNAEKDEVFLYYEVNYFRTFFYIFLFFY